MTEQAKNEGRWSNSALTAGEMYWLTCHVRQMAEDRAEPADSWPVAEAVFSVLLGREVTRWNIQTALSALDDVSESQIVKPSHQAKPEAPGELDRENAAGRIDSIDEVLAREGVRIDKIEGRLECRAAIATGFAIDLRALSQQNAELAQLVTRLEQRVETFEKPFALNSGGEFHDGLPDGGSPSE
jgi:hypothetical protein